MFASSVISLMTLSRETLQQSEETLLKSLVMIFLRKYFILTKFHNVQLESKWDSGHIHFKDLQIDPRAFNNMMYPLVLKFGMIGNCCIKFRFASFLKDSYDVRVYIDRVTLLFLPRWPCNWSEKRERLMRQRQVETLETFGRNWSTHAETLDMLFNKLEKYVRSCSVAVTNVHLRIEDPFTDKARVFACGLTLSELSLDAEVLGRKKGGVKRAVAGSRKENHWLNYIKNFELGKCAIYCDSSALYNGKPFNWSKLSPIETADALVAMVFGRKTVSRDDPAMNRGAERARNKLALCYMLHPVDIKGQLVLAYNRPGNRGGVIGRAQKVGEQVAGFVTQKGNNAQNLEVRIMLKISNVDLQIEQHQMRDAMRMIEYLLNFDRWHMFRRYRPKKRPTNPETAREWWRYAKTCVIADMRDTSPVLSTSWARLLLRYHAREQYMRDYGKYFQDRMFKDRLNPLKIAKGGFNLFGLRQNRNHQRLNLVYSELPSDNLPRKLLLLEDQLRPEEIVAYRAQAVTNIKLTAEERVRRESMRNQVSMADNVLSLNKVLSSDLVKNAKWTLPLMTEASRPPRCEGWLMRLTSTFPSKSWQVGYGMLKERKLATFQMEYDIGKVPQFTMDMTNVTKAVALDSEKIRKHGRCYKLKVESMGGAVVIFASRSKSDRDRWVVEMNALLRENVSAYPTDAIDDVHLFQTEEMRKRLCWILQSEDPEFLRKHPWIQSEEVGHANKVVLKVDCRIGVLQLSLLRHCRVQMQKRLLNNIKSIQVRRHLHHKLRRKRLAFHINVYDDDLPGLARDLYDLEDINDAPYFGCIPSSSMPSYMRPIRRRFRKDMRRAKKALKFAVDPLRCCTKAKDDDNMSVEWFPTKQRGRDLVNRLIPGRRRDASSPQAWGDLFGAQTARTPRRSSIGGFNVYNTPDGQSSGMSRLNLVDDFHLDQGSTARALELLSVPPAEEASSHSHGRRVAFPGAGVLGEGELSDSASISRSEARRRRRPLSDGETPSFAGTPRIRASTRRMSTMIPKKIRRLSIMRRPSQTNVLAEQQEMDIPFAVVTLTNFTLYAVDNQTELQVNIDLESLELENSYAKSSTSMARRLIRPRMDSMNKLIRMSMKTYWQSNDTEINVRIAPVDITWYTPFMQRLMDFLNTRSIYVRPSSTALAESTVNSLNLFGSYNLSLKFNDLGIWVVDDPYGHDTPLSDINFSKMFVKVSRPRGMPMEFSMEKLQGSTGANNIVDALKMLKQIKRGLEGLGDITQSNKPNY